MEKFASTKNFGHGRSLGYAGHHALREAYQGHYATIEAHSERWGQFAAWAKDEHGIRDAREIDRATVEQYGRELAEHVSGGDMSVSYAQNLLSSVNVTLEVLRGDREIRVSPSATVGEHRSAVRDTAPASMDRATVAAATQDLRDRGMERQAVVLEAARDLGLRSREAVMMDYRAALQHAQTGYVDVREGTKGGRGREVERLVPVSDRAMATLQRGAELQQELGARNLIAPGENLKSVSDSLRSDPVRAVMAENSLRGYHDSRAAYACDRYQAITGHPAPAVAGTRGASKEADREARQVIAQELGHGRIDVVAAYVGSAR